jgi:hypothetical protein
VRRRPQARRRLAQRPAQFGQFVSALRGHPLSVRQIEGLAHGFFHGPPSFRQELLQGHLTLALRHLEEAPQDPDSCSDFERIFLHDLEQTQKAMLRVIGKSQDPKLQSAAFRAQANLLTAALLNQTGAFLRTLRQLHDHTGQA